MPSNSAESNQLMTKMERFPSMVSCLGGQNYQNRRQEERLHNRGSTIDMEGLHHDGITSRQIDARLLLICHARAY